MRPPRKHRLASTNIFTRLVSKGNPPPSFCGTQRPGSLSIVTPAVFPCSTPSSITQVGWDDRHESGTMGRSLTADKFPTAPRPWRCGTPPTFTTPRLSTCRAPPPYIHLVLATPTSHFLYLTARETWGSNSYAVSRQCMSPCLITVTGCSSATCLGSTRSSTGRPEPASQRRLGR